MKAIKCPGCDMKIVKGTFTQQDFQHHFWGGHGLDVWVAHRLATAYSERRVSAENAAVALKEKRFD